MRSSFTIALGLVVAGLLVSSSGCTQKASQTAEFHDPSPATTFTNLGLVEFSGETPRHFDLGPANGWNVAAKPLSGGGIDMTAEPDASNTTKIESARLALPPGQIASWQFKTVVVQFTPKFKSQ